MVDRLIGNRVSPTFCVLPWIHRFTNIGGEIQVCCVAEEYHEAIPDAEGKPLNIASSGDDAAVMNQPFMKDLRTKMMSGEWHRICERCRLTESCGGNSRRQFENERYQDLIGELVATTEPNGGVEAKIRSADFRLGNLCNLACRMCNPRSSSSWIREWSKVEHGWFAHKPEELAVFKGYNWYKKPEVWEQFKAQVGNLRHLHFAGGEPLLVPQMIELLRFCVESGHAPNIELTYNTNITKLPEELKKLWPKFRMVRLLCSVDAFGEVNELIRYPSRWADIDRNLRDLDANFAEYGLHEVLCMTTLQVYNVFRLEPLYDYLASGFKNVSPVPQLINLHHPEYYRTQILPPALKALAKSRLLAIQDKTRKRFESGELPIRYSHVQDSIGEAIHFLEAEDYSHRVEGFLLAASSKDRVRGESVFKLIPELEGLKDFVRDRPRRAEAAVENAEIRP